MVAWELEPKLWPSARYQFCSLLTWRALALLIARRAMQTANMSQRERLGRRERLDRWWWFKHWFKQKKEDGSGSERLGRLALTEHYNHLRWHFHCIVVSWLLLFVSIFFFCFFEAERACCCSCSGVASTEVRIEWRKGQLVAASIFFLQFWSTRVMHVLADGDSPPPTNIPIAPSVIGDDLSVFVFLLFFTVLFPFARHHDAVFSPFVCDFHIIILTTYPHPFCFPRFPLDCCSDALVQRKPETVGEKERLTRNERGIAFLHLENEIRIFEASTSSRRMKKEISSFSSFVFLSFWTFHFERFVFLRVPRDKTEYFPEISEISEMK